MASRARRVPQPGAGSTTTAVITRQHRIPIWSLSYRFIGIPDAGFPSPFFGTSGGIISFIQARTQIHACSV